jgi:hypothetical protein
MDKTTFTNELHAAHFFRRWNWKAHYAFHKCPSLDHILSKLNPDIKKGKRKGEAGIKNICIKHQYKQETYNACVSE